MSSTEKTISFRAETEKIDALDALAAAQDRSRSYLINEAISNYIELHAYQDALVLKGMEEMKKGRVVSHEDVVKRLKKDETRKLMIEWTEQAARQLDQAYDYIAISNSEDVATQVTMQIVNRVEQLAAFPMSGRAGRVPGTRELVIPSTPFVVAYTIDKAHIVILAIYHGAQRWPEVF